MIWSGRAMRVDFGWWVFVQVMRRLQQHGATAFSGMESAAECSVRASPISLMGNFNCLLGLTWRRHLDACHRSNVYTFVPVHLYSSLRVWCYDKL